MDCSGRSGYRKRGARYRMSGKPPLLVNGSNDAIWRRGCRCRWEGCAMIELLERQKRLTKNQWKLICTANVADLLDFFDFFLIGYVTAALTKEWSLTYWEGGGILLASGLGAVPGAFLWGALVAR